MKSNMKKILASFTILILVAALSFIPSSAQQFGLQAATISFAGSGNNTIVTAVAGKAVRVAWMWLCVGGTTNVTIVEVRPSVNSGAVPMVANGCMTLPGTPYNGFPLAITTVGSAFIINSSQAVQVSGAAYYDLTNI